MSGHGRTDQILRLPDPDYSPDSGAGFTPDFSISARLLKNVCMDLDEILRVDRCQDMDELINF